MSKYKLFFCLEDGKFKLAQVIECDPKEAHRSADELADESGKKILLCLAAIDGSANCLSLATFIGKRTYITDFGEKYCMSEDYSSAECIGKGGEVK